MTAVKICYFVLTIILNCAAGKLAFTDGDLGSKIAGISNLVDDNIVVATHKDERFYVPTPIPKYKRLNTTEMLHSNGKEYEEFDAITEDGYILKLFHIKGDHSEDPPILLLHGFLDSSDTWLLRGKDSIAINLTESGYDVWLGNCRGNKYSRHHVTLDPDADKEFWDFDFHENGYYDNLAMTDFVLNATGKAQAILIGHSQGTLNQFIGGATRPEYNEKVKLFIALAPIFYTNHVKGLTALASEVAPLAYAAFKADGQVEFLNATSVLRRTLQDLCCTDIVTGYALCASLFFGVFGADPAGYEPDFLPTSLGHYFSGTSVKTIAHGAQLFNHHYGWFDYGPEENMVRYNSTVPPLYDLSNMKTKVILMVGKNDFAADPEDSKMLRDALPNAEYFELPYEVFNHLDFVWGKHMQENFFPYIHNFLNKYK